MKLDSVHSAKAEIFTKAFGYREIVSSHLADDGGALFSPAGGTEAYDAVSAARKLKKRDARELIAVGILPSGHNKDPNAFELAILIQQKKLIQHPIVEQARRLAHGEARVIVTGPASRHSSPVNPGRHRPLKIGSSIGHYRITAGTLGCFAKCRRYGGIGILSNNHVLANLNRAKHGDPIIQPGRGDQGTIPADVVATLFRYIPIDFAPTAVNLVDCAFATLVDDIDYLHQEVGPRGAGGWMVDPPDALLLSGIDVQKWGRSTGHTDGIVTATNVDNITVAMVLGDPSKVARFDNQIAISGKGKSFSKPGDSGSVVFAEGRPVGLLFAGTESGGANGGGTSYANEIGSVLDLLDIDVYRS